MFSLDHLFTVFVKKYAKYLEEKVSVLRLLGYQFEKNQDAVKNLKGQAVYKVIPKLQSQLNALLNCKVFLNRSLCNYFHLSSVSSSSRRSTRGRTRSSITLSSSSVKIASCCTPC